MTHKIDLDALDRSARQANGTFTVGDAIVPSLIARIRELEGFIAATPDAALQADKVHRDDFPGMFAETGDTCMAMYMDAAKSKILERGAVLELMQVTAVNPGLPSDGRRIPVIDKDGRPVGHATAVGDRLSISVADADMARRLATPNAPISVGYSLAGEPLEVAEIE